MAMSWWSMLEECPLYSVFETWALNATSCVYIALFFNYFISFHLINPKNPPTYPKYVFKTKSNIFFFFFCSKRTLKFLMQMKKFFLLFKKYWKISVFKSQKMFFFYFFLFLLNINFQSFIEFFQKKEKAKIL